MAPATALDFSKPHVLRNAREFKTAVAELDQLADADPKRGTEAYDRLELLAVLIEAYENEHNPIDEKKGTPQSVVAFMLEQKGMTRADLAAHMGGEGARVRVLLREAPSVHRAGPRAPRRARDPGRSADLVTDSVVRSRGMICVSRPEAVAVY